VVRAVKGLCLLYPGKYKAMMPRGVGQARTCLKFLTAKIKESTKKKAKFPFLDIYWKIAVVVGTTIFYHSADTPWMISC